MKTSPQIILFELNEVPWRVIDDFVVRHPRSALARLTARAATYVTHCDNPVSLSPWSVWATLHRGVSDAEHGIRYLGQPGEECYPPLWEILAAARVPVGVFGCLNTYPIPRTREAFRFFVPDAFAPEPECIPEALRAFQRFNLEMSRRSGRNVSRSIAPASALAFLRVCRGLGLEWKTLARIAGQLVAEVPQPTLRGRRRNLQCSVAFDLFLRQLRQENVRFATFFTNHVAAALHRYWAARYPDDYTHYELPHHWTLRYAEEIDFALKAADRCIERLMLWADGIRGTEIWVASGAGQVATQARTLKTQLYLANLSRFMRGLGVPDAAWSARPGMAPHVGVVVEAPVRSAFRAQLESLRIGDQRLHWEERENGFFKLGIDTPDVDAAATRVSLGGERFALGELGFENTAIDEGAASTAHHHPDGSLLVYGSPTRPPRGSRIRVPVTALAPALLRRLGAAPPSYMVGADGL